MEINIAKRANFIRFEITSTILLEQTIFKEPATLKKTKNMVEFTTKTDRSSTPIYALSLNRLINLLNFRLCQENKAKPEKNKIF
jgi:hypothetical protein